MKEASLSHLTDEGTRLREVKLSPRVTQKDRTGMGLHLKMRIESSRRGWTILQKERWSEVPG